MADLNNDKIFYNDLFISDGSKMGNALVVWNFFKYKGLSDEAVAGIMGNIDIDSNFDPLFVNKGAYGLLQFSKGEKMSFLANAKIKKVDWGNLQFQLEYIWNEYFESNKGISKKLRDINYNDIVKISDSVYLFHKFAEHSNDTFSQIKQTRFKSAQDLYKIFKNSKRNVVVASNESMYDVFNEKDAVIDLTKYFDSISDAFDIKDYEDIGKLFNEYLKKVKLCEDNRRIAVNILLSIIKINYDIVSSDYTGDIDSVLKNICSEIDSKNYILWIIKNSSKINLDKFGLREIIEFNKKCEFPMAKEGDVLVSMNDVFMIVDNDRETQQLLIAKILDDKLTLETISYFKLAGKYVVCDLTNIYE